MTTICLCGATGHVGRELAAAIHNAPDLTLTAAVGAATAGQRLSEVLGRTYPDVPIFASVAEAHAKTTFDIMIDYTTPAAVYDNVTAAIRRQVHCVIGTSGLTDEQYTDIHRLAEEYATGVLAAGNFSITATLMQHFAALAARHIPQWEIVDYGTDTKVDAPSGTSRELAFKLSQVGAPAYTIDPQQTVGLAASRGAELNGSRVHSLRLPGFYSSSEVIMGLPGERLTLRHDSMSYQPYVSGTLLAARQVHTFTGLKRGLSGIMDLDA